MKSKNVKTIPATIDRFNKIPIEKNEKLKVAAYARVSTDSEEQLSSYESQINYYTEYINKREDWEFVKVYTDEGITGTSTKHREGFKNMIRDALDGKINLIITKSVSRFARNTVDSLSYIRQLKENGVECYFEKENIRTFDDKGELLLTIMSSIAQEEARSVSENCIWGQRKRFEAGKVSVPFCNFLGYDRGSDGNLKLNPHQAKIIRKIYGMFIQGFSVGYVAKYLTESNIKTPAGKDIWYPSTVKSILTNEKYKGDAMLQKTYTLDYLSKKKMINNGEVPKYYVSNNHEAIIEKDIFDYVQKILKRKTPECNSVNIYSNKIKCGVCGKVIGSKTVHSNDKYRKIVWKCGCGCGIKNIDKSKIELGFVTAINKLFRDKSNLTEDFEYIRRLSDKKEEIDIFCEKLKNQKEILMDFDELLWLNILNCIIINSDCEFEVILKNGLKTKVII